MNEWEIRIKKGSGDAQDDSGQIWTLKVVGDGALLKTEYFSLRALPAEVRLRRLTPDGLKQFALWGAADFEEFLVNAVLIGQGERWIAEYAVQQKELRALPDSPTPSMGQQLKDAGFGSAGPM